MPTPPSPTALRLLLAATVFLSAFLLFLVQPLIARQILPWFGGGSGVWSACMVFFQTVLLAGYAYADLGTRRLAPRPAAGLHVLLLLAALLTLPVLADPAWQPQGGEPPAWRIVALLAATVGLPYFLLASTGPLLQAWYARALPAAGVYRLYALSNAGSLLALLAYPTALEPWLTLTQQAWVWSAAFLVFALLCAASAWYTRDGTAEAAVAQGTEPGLAADQPAALTADGATHPAGDAGHAPRAHDAARDAAPPGWRSLLLWLLLSGLGVLLLLSITHHLTQNVASTPFLWLAPLALYLLSFILTFDARDSRGGWYRRGLFAPLLMLALPAMAWGLVTEHGVLPFRQAVPLYLAGLFVACMFCHGELVARRPAPRHLTRFYLMVSLGGALGGLFVGIIAPQVFPAYYELPIGLGLCALLLTGLMARRLPMLGWVIAAGTVLVWLPFALLLAGESDLLGWPLPAPPLEDGARPLGPLLALGLVGLAGLGLLRAMGHGLGMSSGLVACVLTAHFVLGYEDLLRDGTLEMKRNFYGTLRVTMAGVPHEDAQLNTELRRLVHGVIMHGEQFVSPHWRTLPTSYYGTGSGSVRALRALLARHRAQANTPAGSERPGIRVGVIGLGVGTLAAYGLPGDVMRFYELNPQVIDVAQRLFWYLSDSAAQIDLVAGDARLSLQAEDPQGYDLIVVDAFSSDAIPTHLLTREALQVYLRHLRPDGIVAFHVTNRYLNLPPVIELLARDAGLQLRRVIDDPHEAVLSYTDHVLLSRDAAVLAHEAFEDLDEAIEPIPGLRLWTDHHSPLLRILR